MTKKILPYLKNMKEVVNTFDRYGDNIAHYTLFFRKNREGQLDSNANINYMLDTEILSICDDKTWNQINADSFTPLELVTSLDYDVYSKIIIKNKIKVDPNIIKKLEDELKDLENGKKKNHKLWIELYKKQPKYIHDKDNIIIDEHKYSHSTLFQAKFKDVALFSLYLNDTHKNLLVPNMASYTLNYLTFDDSMPFADDLVAREPIFPWFISFRSSEEYYIHPYLNNLINAERRSGDKRFAVIFLNLIFEKILHANVLIYDFKNMTVERFEPYGNTQLIDYTVDDILEEELTWSTGLKYIRPENFLPWAGFQTISDESNNSNKKAGDFGGFCLAWCLWYLETKLKNPDVDSKTLVEKLINKLNSSDMKFSEYIRNYSNKINKKRVEYLKELGIDEKEASNVNLSIINDNKLTQFIVSKFSNNF